MKFCKVCGERMLTVDRFCSVCEADSLKLIDGLCHYVSHTHGQCKAPGVVSWAGKSKTKPYYCLRHWLARDSRSACELIMNDTKDIKRVSSAMVKRRKQTLIARPELDRRPPPRFMGNLRYYAKRRDINAQ